MAKNSQAVANIAEGITSDCIHRNIILPARNLYLPDLVSFVAEKAIPENILDFTLNPNTLTMANVPEDDYWVAIDGHEQKYFSIPDKRIIRDWIRPRIFILSKPLHYIGWWFDEEEEKYCLDISVPITGKEQALVFAYKNRQKSIYHPATSQTIYVVAKYGAGN